MCRCGVGVFAKGRSLNVIYNHLLTHHKQTDHRQTIKSFSLRLNELQLNTSLYGSVARRNRTYTAGARWIKIPSEAYQNNNRCY